MSRMEGEVSACTWLRNRVGHHEVDLAGYEQVQLWRMNWLKDLAKEFSSAN